MKALAFALALLAPLSHAEPADRWVQATSLMLRKEASATAPILGRLQQGSRVTISRGAQDDAEWCEVSAHRRTGFVACRHLSVHPVPAPRAGEDGTPSDRRWVGGSSLLLRAQPRPDAAVLARLRLNTTLKLLGEDAGNGYCPVQLVDDDAVQGFTACRYLQRSPLDWESLTLPGRDDDNPAFDPARAFWIDPSWELMAHYARRVYRQRAEQGDAAPKGADEQLERMKARLSGHTFSVGEPLTVWPEWEALRAEADMPARRSEASLLTEFLGRWDGGPSDKQPLLAAFVRSLPLLPKPAPSWWRSEKDLSGPGESVAALATHFGGRVQWLHESLQPGSPNRGSIDPGWRIERMTLPLWRISLMSSQSLGAVHVRPEDRSLDWDTWLDFMCPGWTGGFSHGDSSSATYQRNEIQRRAPAGPLTLFRFWSGRPLPAGPARWTRQTFKLDREQTGFVSGERRTVDLDGDGVVDLVWLQATGRGPGHLGGEPQHDDAWYRLLLANVAGRWRLVATDQFSYGCGC